MPKSRGTGVQVISFRLSQVVDGLSIALCVEISSEALRQALGTEESSLIAAVDLCEAYDSIREALQAEAVRRLNEVTGELQLRLARKTLELMETSLRDSP